MVWNPVMVEWQGWHDRRFLQRLLLLDGGETETPVAEDHRALGAYARPARWRLLGSRNLHRELPSDLVWTLTSPGQSATIHRGPLKSHEHFADLEGSRSSVRQDPSRLLHRHGRQLPHRRCSQRILS